MHGSRSDRDWKFVGILTLPLTIFRAKQLNDEKTAGFFTSINATPELLGSFKKKSSIPLSGVDMGVMASKRALTGLASMVRPQCENDLTQ
uniref:Uncharacterized protein n=1 Tax=Romanomermis culicivorax TaxID=13658 RepID=A0A915IKH0_ROMCU